MARQQTDRNISHLLDRRERPLGRRRSRGDAEHAGPRRRHFRLWIDGRLEAERTGLDWRGTWNERGFNAIFLENYWNDGSPVRQARTFDDFVVSTAPIGLARTSLNPEIVKLPFALTSPGGTQVAWQAQVGTDATTPELVWDSGAMTDAGERVRVDREHGLFVGPLVGQHALAPGTRYSVRVRQRVMAARGRRGRAGGL